MTPTPSDAFVFFGATGDLAYKKIFPALQALVRHGRLTVPIVGVAKAGWTLEQLRALARASLDEHGGGVVRDDDFARLVDLLRYVDGDYRDAATFGKIATAPAKKFRLPSVPRSTSANTRRYRPGRCRRKNSWVPRIENETKGR